MSINILRQSWTLNSMPCNLLCQVGIRSSTSYTAGIQKKSECYESVDNEFVITGISGRFPQSENMEEFRDNLFSRRDMVTPQNRFKCLGIPDRMGLMKSPEKFDANFFGIIPKLANFMDPQQRKILEVAFEAIIDAGINPNSLRQSSTGVFAGAAGSDLLDYWLPRADKKAMEGYAVTCSPLALANRVSYLLDFKGPSLTICTGCSSSLVALEAAVQSIRSGACNAAVVVSSAFQGSSFGTADFSHLGAVSKEGMCRSFDEQGTGYARSEAISAVFVQKRKDSCRVYATIQHILSNADGYKAAGFTYPSAVSQEKLFGQMYSESGIDPSEVQYVECHGTGTPGGDTEEVQAAHSVFCKPGGRKTPLLIGSVKSNMGHAESAAGMCGIAKVIISIQEGKIPPNLHFNKPRKVFAHLFEKGDLQVVTEDAAFNGGYIGISSFGIGGTNAHLLLKADTSDRVNKSENTRLPILLPLCGRTEGGVRDSLENALELAKNREFVALIHNVFKSNISGYNVRGCAIAHLDKSQPSDIKIKTECNVDKRPLCFIFANVEKAPAEVCKDVSKLEPFNKSLLKSTKILTPKTTRLNPALLPGPTYDAKTSDWIASNVAIQIALFDLLSSIDVQPDILMGESSGSILCEYADGCLSSEEALMYAESKAHDLQEPSSTMTDKSRDKLLPIARGRQSKRVRNKTDENHKVFPFPSETTFLDSLRRSNPDLSKPTVIIDVSPKTRTSWLKEDYLVLPVTAENGNHLFSSLQELYTSGMNLDFSSLYPKVAFPVSAKTPGLSHLMKWNHQENWKVPIVPNYTKAASSGMTFTVDLSSRDDEFLKDHVINNQVIFPATGYICMAWEGLAMNLGVDFRDLPIVIKDICFTRAILLDEQTPTEFRFLILNDRGNFEIQERGTTVAQGVIQVADNLPCNHTTSMERAETEKMKPLISCMNSNDIYKEFALRGFNFSGQFCSIQCMNLFRTKVNVNWNNNWITLLDSALQVLLLSSTGDDRSLVVPTSIKKATIYPKTFLSFCHNNNEKSSLSTIPVEISDVCNRVSAPGVELSGLLTNVVSKRQRGTCVVEQQRFTPYLNTDKLKHMTESFLNQNGGLGIFEMVDLFLENVCERNPKIVEVSKNADDTITRRIQHVMSKNPGYDAKYTLLTEKSHTSRLKAYSAANSTGLAAAVSIMDIDEAGSDIQPQLVVLTQTALEKLSPKLTPILKDCPFVLLLTDADEPRVLQEFVTIATTNHEEWKLQLLKRKFVPDLRKIEKISIDGSSWEWLPDLKLAMEKANNKMDPQIRIYLTSECNTSSGIIGLIKCLRLELGGEGVRGIFDTQGKLSLDFESPNPDLMNVLEKDLLVNVIQDGTIGSFRYVPYWDDQTIPTKYLEDAYADMLQPGDISSIGWIGLPKKAQHERWEQPETSITYKNEPLQRCTVNYASLSFKDVMLATKRLSIYSGNVVTPQSMIGLEFSGKDKQQNRVMGFSSGRAIATSIMADPSHLWQVPEEWTLEEAATVPVAYYTAYLALFYRARVQNGQSILIHSASGALGQAAVTLATHTEMDIYATVGSDAKRAFLKNVFPDLEDDKIFSSQNCEFAEQLMNITRGKGVDIVLNSLSEEKLQASLSCVALHGKFLELGKFDIHQNSPLGMNCFLKNMEFHGIDGPASYKDRTAHLCTSSLLEQGLTSGVVKPIPRQVFDCTQLENALQHMSSGKHTGKVVIKVQRESDGLPPKLSGKPCTHFHPDKIYIIAGGLGGLGLEVANWLVQRGCRYIALTSRSGVVTGYQASRLKIWKEKGVVVLTPKADLSCYVDTENFLKNLTNVRTVGGIFNSCLVLKDALIENQTPEMFQAVAAPKVQLTKNLDELSRKLCPDLEYFVVFSSAACGRGNLGQSAYGLANSAIERMCEQRQKEGLHALAIQWGYIGGVGAAENLMNNSENQLNFEESQVSKGTEPQSVVSCLQVLDLSLNQDAPVLSSRVLARGTTTKTQTKRGVLEFICSMCGIHDISKVRPERKLSNVGIDSLSCVHLKNMLLRDYGLSMTTAEVRNLTFETLFAINAGSFRRKA